MADSEIIEKIEASLSGTAKAYWSGCSQVEVDAAVELARRMGVWAAVDELEDLSRNK